MKISILGDPHINWFSTPITKPDTSSYTWKQSPGFAENPREGGSIQVCKLVKQLTTTGTEISGLELNDLPSYEKDQIVQWKCELSGAGSTHSVSRGLGFVGPLNGLPKILSQKIPTGGADIIGIFDYGNGFSECDVSNIESVDSQRIICFSKTPKFDSPLWNNLKNLNSENLVYITNLDSVRSLDSKISKGLSWEKTFKDFVEEIVSNPELTPLKTLEHLIVRAGTEGTIYWNGSSRKATLIYDAESIEGESWDKTCNCEILFEEVYTACLIAGFSRMSASQFSISSVIELVKKTIQFTNCFFEKGYDATGFSNFELFSGQIEKTNASRYHSATVTLPEAEEEIDNWEFDLTVEKLTESIEDLAQDIVLKNSQTAQSGIPTAQFNFLKTLDRKEAEGFRSIQSLITEYLAKPSPERPLSFAVFGFPGSGKSFGVKQIAKKLGDKLFTFLEANVSQFSDEQDLIIFFNKVRDVVLKGKVPLVFFDEFDSKRGDQILGWLKNFLAPMQDGEYKDGEDTHPIGRSIFVFAGGTANTFQQFTNRPKEQIRDFRKAKGPDFVSRLRGFVNIRSFNPEREDCNYLKSPEDNSILLRRALILRSVFERSYKQLLDADGNLRIDYSLLDGLLKIGRYKNGVRSMEALLDMSSIAGKVYFGRSDLPSKDQLELVVDPDDFYAIIERKTKFNAKILRIAKAIHERYLEDQKAKNTDKKASHVTWEELDETYKASNIDQAKHIIFKLSNVGADFRPNQDWNSDEFKFTQDEIEKLSIIEHDRWQNERELDGWTRGEPRDDAQKIHPNLVKWELLTDEIKGYDRDAICAIPEVMSKAGFEVYRK